MRSLTAGLARQVMVVGAMGPLLFAALTASPSGFGHAPAASASFDRPIHTRAIVIAEAPPAPQPVKAAPAIKLLTPKPIPHPRLAAATLAPRARPAEQTSQVIAASYLGPAPQADPPLDLRKRLFAPVGFVRDNVARFMSWM